MPATNINHSARLQSSFGALPYTRANQLNARPDTTANGNANRLILVRRLRVAVIRQRTNSW